MKKEKVLSLSIALNVILLVAAGSVAIHKREKIVEKVQTLFGTYQSPKESELANFNNEPLEAVNDSIIVGADTTITCLILGNSLTYHPVVDEEPAPGKRGLTSTRIEKDYVHVLLNKLSTNNHLNIKYSLLNIAQFERTFTEHSFTMQKLKLATNQQPDFLIVQKSVRMSRKAILRIQRSLKQNI